MIAERFLYLRIRQKESKQLADKLEEMVKRTKRICISVLSEKALKKELVQFAKEDARHLDVVFCDLPVCAHVASRFKKQKTIRKRLYSVFIKF